MVILYDTDQLAIAGNEPRKCVLAPTGHLAQSLLARSQLRASWSIDRTGQVTCRWIADSPRLAASSHPTSVPNPALARRNVMEISP